MPWVISGLTRMHHFLSCPAILRPVAVFHEAPPRSELPFKHFIETLPWLEFLSFSLHCIIVASAIPAWWRLSGHRAPAGLEITCHHNTAMVLPGLRTTHCNSFSLITWLWSAFYQYFKLETYRLHTTTMVLSGLPATHCHGFPSINQGCHPPLRWCLSDLLWFIALLLMIFKPDRSTNACNNLTVLQLIRRNFDRDLPRFL